MLKNLALFGYSPFSLLPNPFNTEGRMDRIRLTLYAFLSSFVVGALKGVGIAADSRVVLLMWVVLACVNAWFVALWCTRRAHDLGQTGRWITISYIAYAVVMLLQAVFASHPSVVTALSYIYLIGAVPYGFYLTLAPGQKGVNAYGPQQRTLFTRKESLLTAEDLNRTAPTTTSTA